jgi:hypothetical protein
MAAKARQQKPGVRNAADPAETLIVRLRAGPELRPRHGKRPVLLLGEAPRDREQKRPPGSTLSRSVSACLTYRALARRTRPLLWSHTRLRKGPSLLGKGLDLRKLVAGGGFEPPTSGL